MQKAFTKIWNFIDLVIKAFNYLRSYFQPSSAPSRQITHPNTGSQFNGNQPNIAFRNALLPTLGIPTISQNPPHSR
jgi:hypothetical protein